MSEEILREKEKYWDNKITLEEYINSTEKEGWIDTGDYEYEFYYIIDNLKKTQLLENIIKEVREYMNKHEIEGVYLDCKLYETKAYKDILEILDKGE